MGRLLPTCRLTALACTEIHFSAGPGQQDLHQLTKSETPSFQICLSIKHAKPSAPRPQLGVSSGPPLGPPFLKARFKGPPGLLGAPTGPREGLSRALSALREMSVLPLQPGSGNFCEG